MNITHRLPPYRTTPRMLAAILAIGALAGCGAEVAGTAAVAGGLAAAQARQAQSQQAQVADQVKAGLDAGAARAGNAGD